MPWCSPQFALLSLHSLACGPQSSFLSLHSSICPSSSIRHAAKTLSITLSILLTSATILVTSGLKRARFALFCIIRLSISYCPTVHLIRSSDSFDSFDSAAIWPLVKALHSDRLAPMRVWISLRFRLSPAWISLESPLNLHAPCSVYSEWPNRSGRSAETRCVQEIGQMARSVCSFCFLNAKRLWKQANWRRMGVVRRLEFRDGHCFQCEMICMINFGKLEN